MLDQAALPFLSQRGHIVSLVGGGGKTTLLYQMSAHCARKGWRVLASTTTHIRCPQDGHWARMRTGGMRCGRLERTLWRESQLRRIS